MSSFILRQATQTLLEWSTFFPAVAIVGPRQVGKTSLAKYLQEVLEKPSIYLDLENPADLAKLNEAALFLAPYKDHTVILDEIQKAPHLFPVLRGIIDEDRKPGRFVLLGSASPDLIRDSSETLAGRIAYYELPPFTWNEVAAHGAWRDHWLRGGFPESFLAPSDTLSGNWRQQFIRTYLERDLPLLGLSANPILTQRLWAMCAHQTGQVLNLDKLGASLGISGATVRRYLDFFEAAYLVRRLPPYHTNLKKRLVKSPKLFVRDSGILHQLLGIGTFFELSGHSMLGASWETYIIEQVAAMLPEWGKLYFYRTQAGTEVDLVITRGDQPDTLIEIKYSQTPRITRGFHIAQEDLKARRRVVVAPVDQSHFLQSDIEVLGMNDLESLFA